MSVSNKSLARWYRETSQHLKAGFPLPRALETAGGVPVRDRKRLATELLAGNSIDSVLRKAPRWLPEIDRYVLSSAAQSGQILETLRVLSENRAFAGKQAAQAAGAAVYPLFLVHFAILIVPIYLLVTQGVEPYLRLVIPAILPLWVVLAFLFWSVRRRLRWVRMAMRFIPLLRGYTRHRSVADLCFTLRAYLAAGETIDVAWFGAAKASDDRRLRGLGEKVSNQARLGVPPSGQIANVKTLPEEFISLYQTGEQTGQLEENLDHLWMLFSERASDKLRAASFWYPKLMIIVVALGIGYVVVTAYAGYLSQITDLL